MAESIFNMVSKMAQLVEIAKTDAAKFDEKGNGAAGARIRKAMQEVKGMAHVIRFSVSEAKKK